MATLKSVLDQWADSKVVVINPQSFIETQIQSNLVMETYEAQLVEVGEDFIRLKFDAKKKKEELPVDQVVPLHELRRISTWGDERFIHL